MNEYFDYLSYIVDCIKNCIQQMKDTMLPFNVFGLNQTSYYDMFVGIGVGAILIDIALSVFGGSKSELDELSEADEPFADDDDY